jgi:hypothetical protein
VKLGLMPFGIAVCVAGVASFGVLPRVGAARPVAWSLVLLGAGFLLMGLDGIVTGRSTSGWSKSSQTHYGASARLRGAALAFLGLAIGAANLVEALGFARTSDLLSGTRGLGLTLMVAGILVALGSGMLLAESAGKPFWRALPGRLLGLLLLLASLAGAAGGAVVALSPGTFDAWTRQLRSGRALGP